MTGGRYEYVDGILHADVEGTPRTFVRPCDWLASCGPQTFLGATDDTEWTPAAREALATIGAFGDNFHPLRGMPDDFLVGWAESDTAVSVCGLARDPTTLTVRFEDVWDALPAERRAFSYSCSVTRDPHEKDSQESISAKFVREDLRGLAPDVRICLDLARWGGFAMRFAQEAE